MKLHEKITVMIDSVLDMLNDYEKKHMSKGDRYLIREIERIFRGVKQNQPPSSDNSLPLKNDYKAGDGKQVGIYHKPGRMTSYIKTENNWKLRQRLENQKKILVSGIPGIGKTEGVLWYLDKVSFSTVIWLNFGDLEQAIKEMSDFFMTVEREKGKWDGENLMKLRPGWRRQNLF